MGTVIGDLLPLGLGVAISPVPIIAVILMLLAPRAGAASAGFGLVPVIGYAVAKQQMRHPLDELKVWLQQNNVTVMAVLLLVIGVALAGKGLGGLL
jgi:hypothetical protein